MTKAEVIQLFKKIKRHYANFDVMDTEKVDEWYRFLKDSQTTVVHENLERHITAEKWPPTIAELTRPFEPAKTENDLYHEHLRNSTRILFDEMEEWRKRAVPPPAHVKERMRQMGDVVDTTTDQDFQTFGRLKTRVPDTVGMIRLAYGQDADKFLQYPFYHIDVTTQKVVWDTLPQNDLEAAKAAKIAQLDFLCNQEILAGFTSSALGTAHQYDFDDEAQRNLTGRLALINANPNYPDQS